MEKVLGEMRVSEVARILEEMGDPDAEKLKPTTKMRSGNVKFKNFSIPGFDLIYRYTNHEYGFLPPASARRSKSNILIENAKGMEADPKMKGQTVKITLDGLLVHDYPGLDIFGHNRHNILFEFECQHQAADQVQELSFAHNFEVMEGQDAGVNGCPIFVGLKVGQEGVRFQCTTINVSSQADKEVLKFMEGDAFKGGLQLIDAVNPAMPVVTGLVTGVVKLVLTWSENRQVQYFDLGLDFSNIQVNAKLREGSYIVAQAPEDFDWADWVWSPRGKVVSANDPKKGLPYNHVIFSVSKM